MWFTILGSGTHFPDPQKRSAGYLLRDGKNLIQLDFGYGTLLRLVGMKVRYQDIRHIFLTHMHEDHYLDLLPFLNTLVIQVAQWGLAPCTLYLYGPKGFRKKLQNIRAAIGVKTTEPFVRIVFRELTRARVIMGKVTVRSHPVHHVATINALCYRIDKGRQSIAYTGDLDYDESIIPFLKGVHTLVIECGFPNHMKQAGHLTPREAGMIAHQAGVKRVVLTHRFPPCEKVNIVNQYRKEFGGRILLARDLLALTV